MGKREACEVMLGGSTVTSLVRSCMPVLAIKIYKKNQLKYMEYFLANWKKIKTKVKLFKYL